jgi:uncharacterized membrane protein (DUF4010 family)
LIDTAFMAYSKIIPESLIPIFLVLALGFLIGLEREDRLEPKLGGHYSFGGVRTFPLIGLCGYMIARLSEGSGIAIAIGFLGLSALLWLSYQKKLSLAAQAGITTEISALFTYLLGALLAKGAFWEGTALAVAALLLLELKTSLEKIARTIPTAEIFTFTRFLLITAVVLPLLPNRPFTEYELNPFRIWLVVVAISGLSYVAYILGLLFGKARGALISAALGGLYSSTVTTVVLAKRSREENNPEMFAGSILVASGLMYFRLTALLFIFNPALGRAVLLPFLLLGALASGVGYGWAQRGKKTPSADAPIERSNPLQLGSAFMFAFLFVFMAVLTKLVLQHAGQGGLFGLSFITGLTDIDPFVMSLSQSAGISTPINVAAKGIIIASTSNDIMKGAYAFAAGSGAMRWQALGLLLGLAIATSSCALLLIPAI